MKCPKCHFDKPDTQRYFGECGTQLALSEEAPISQTKTLKIPIHEIKRGTTFANRFEFIEELGKGGMGRVYKVYDKRIKECRYVRARSQKQRQHSYNSSLSIRIR